MDVSVFMNLSIGRRGRLVVQLSEKGQPVDQELIVKHPLLLRVRMALALSRMKRRQRKIKKFLARHA